MTILLHGLPSAVTAQTTQKAMREGMKNPDDFAEFANEFGTDHNREIYEMEVVEKTEDRLSIDFHYCPYVTEWVKQGHTPEEIAHLCDLTMEGDREFAKQFPCLKFELKGTIADGTSGLSAPVYESKERLRLILRTDVIEKSTRLPPKQQRVDFLYKKNSP
mgnify:CR=1 FL=1